MTRNSLGALAVLVGLFSAFGSAGATDNTGKAVLQDEHRYRCDPDSYPEHFIDWTAAHPYYEGGTTPWPVDSLERQPERIKSPPLEYPYDNHIGRWEGWVMLEAVVEADSSVQFVELLDVEVWHKGEARANPHDTGSLRVAMAFVKVAQQLLRESEFVAGELRGEAVPALVCMPITFELLAGRVT